MRGYLMFELKRTQARAAFKDLLGQANHFLITILIGLNGVRAGRVTHDPEFHAAWNPKDVIASADRSRVFALDLALVRAVDALDTYMMTCRRAPTALGNTVFESDMDATGQSVLKRLNVFLTHINDVPKEHATLMRLAIAWRNKRVHSLAENEIDAEDRDELLQSADKLGSFFRGLSVIEVLERFDAGASPHFKDAASVIALAHKLVEAFDRELLARLDIEEYVRVSLRRELSRSAKRIEVDQLKAAARKLWGDPEQRAHKVARALRFVGVHRVDVITARQVPAPLIERIMGFGPEEAVLYLGGATR